MDNLKIGYSYFDSIQEIDPANIQTIFQANIIENIYSRLIELDNDGQLSCVLCSNFWIEKNEIKFKIRNDFITTSGYKITANDVKFSLTRLYKLNTNTHGNLNHFINSENDLIVDNDIFSIKLKNHNHSQFIIPLLTSMDYSIIPINSVDKNNHISDYSNTTGAYFVYKSDNQGNITLKINTTNPIFNKESIAKITIVPTTNKDAVDSFLQNKIDIIDVTTYPRASYYEKLFTQEKVKFNSFKTLPMNLLYLGISPKTHRNFTDAEIFSACKKISGIYSSFKTFGYGFQTTVEFFQQGSNGHLERFELDHLEQLRKSNTLLKNKKINFGVLKSSFEKVKLAFKEELNINVISFEEDPAFLPKEQQPDIFIQTTDSSFTEDFNLLSYNLITENFGLSKDEGYGWLEKYINIQEKKDRILKLKELQLNFLKKPFLYPIGVSPYWAIARSDIELNFPTLFPGSHWWKIRLK